jgi:hypothetical protein
VASIDETRGAVGRPTGWVKFAGILLIVVGAFNVVDGFALLERHQYFTHHIVYSNLNFWGWVFIIWGVLQLIAGFASLGGQMIGNYIGVLLGFIGTTLWFFMIFSEPGAAVLGVTLNILIIYGLTAGATGEWSD